jgi:hypothetical protein
VKVLVDDFAQAADFIRPQKRGRTAAEMELHGLAVAGLARAPCGHFAAQRSPHTPCPWAWFSVITVVQPQNQHSVSQKGMWK